MVDYRIDPKFSDRYALANSADPESDQGLHCSPFLLHRLDSLLYGILNHISCKLCQISRALGWYSSLSHIPCKLDRLSRALGLIFKSQPYLLNLASCLEPWADIQVSAISLVILASYLEPWADIQVSALIMRQPTSFECISLFFRIIPTQSVKATGPVFRNIVVLLHIYLKQNIPGLRAFAMVPVFLNIWHILFGN